ncbi:MAG TPA: DMT family transporter [Stellaceae bacterium]|nr:DMT family transporter [Stellaceae bacterium]
MSADRRLQLDSAAIALMVLLCACWGFNQVAIKLANGGISPIFQAGLRSVGSALLVWAWSAHRGVRLFAGDGTLGFGLLIGALFSAEFVFLYCSLVFTSASRAVLFLYMSPFVVALGAHVLIPGERLRWLQVVGLLCAFAGTALAFGDALRFPTYRELLGDGMAFIAALLWGATTVVIKASRLARISPHKNLLYQLGVSAILLPILSWVAGEPGIIAATPLVLAMLAYQIVIVAFASYLAWFWLISRYPAGRLSSFSFLTPLFGLLAGALILGEPVGWALLLALALVGSGIALVNRPAAAPPTAARAAGVDTGER